MSDDPLKNIPYFEDSFADAQRFQLMMNLKSTVAERLQDLEAMWNFAEMVWEKNPHILRTAEKLWALQR